MHFRWTNIPTSVRPATSILCLSRAKFSSLRSAHSFRGYFDSMGSSFSWHGVSSWKHRVRKRRLRLMIPQRQQPLPRKFA
ncbi:Alpha-amylase A type-1/2 [Fusarium oxysporum f. sp. albedinis]|nr:Alpha-amylase A type-1/2 [Fusarium oxysporum f. sp. albedinis]